MIELQLDAPDARLGALEAGRQCAVSGPVQLLDFESCRVLKVLLDEKKPLPFEIQGAAMALCAVSLSGEGEAVSFAPWPSESESDLCEVFVRAGAAAIIGSGNKSQSFFDAVREQGSTYLCPTGGAGALYAACVSGVSGQGPARTAILNRLPVLVAADSRGKNIFNRD